MQALFPYLYTIFIAAVDNDHSEGSLLQEVKTHV